MSQSFRRISISLALILLVGIVLYRHGDAIGSSATSKGIIPSGVTSVVSVRYSPSGVIGSPELITDLPTINELRSVANHLPPFPNGVTNCPSGPTTSTVVTGLRIEFRYSDAKDIRLDEQVICPPGEVTANIAGKLKTGGFYDPTLHLLSLTFGTPFPDVPIGYWAAPYIERLWLKGIMNGFPDGSFQPEAAVTRAQFTKMLLMAVGLRPGAGATPFTDVPSSAWYAPYVATAVQAKLVRGTSPTTFSPDAAVTREEMAVMLARALKPTKSTTIHFTDDAQIGAWATAGVEKAVAAGYLNGFPNGSFHPVGTTTRAQAAKALARVLKREPPVHSSCYVIHRVPPPPGRAVPPPGYDCLRIVPQPTGGTGP